MLNSMRKQDGGLMQNSRSQAPGYARVMADPLQGAIGNLGSADLGVVNQ
jgi:hypothetical protein